LFVQRRIPLVNEILKGVLKFSDLKDIGIIRLVVLGSSGKIQYWEQWPFALEIIAIATIRASEISGFHGAERIRYCLMIFDSSNLQSPNIYEEGRKLWVRWKFPMAYPPPFMKFLFGSCREESFQPQDTSGSNRWCPQFLALVRRRGKRSAQLGKK